MCPTRTEKDPLSETLDSLEYRTMDNVKELSNPKVGHGVLKTCLYKKI
jgi:hypothetical protein